MASSREEALRILSALAKKHGSGKLENSNEAETRLLLVDELLLAVGWKKEEFLPEKKVGELSYLDYQLTADEVPRLIVEAKRAGHTFGPTRNKLRRTEYKLGYMQSAFGASFTEVLDQAIKYAHETRIPYAALTNGREWVLCHLLAPPGEDPKQLKCYYLGDLLAEDHHFDLFWELVSRPSVLDGALEDGFSSLNRFESEYCVEPRTLLGQLSWEPAPDDAELREFHHRFFDEITDSARRRMLEYCFVSNSNLDQYEGALKRALTDAAPSFIDADQELTPDDSDMLLARSSSDQKGRVVLVTGSVGVGKSTFVTKTLVEHRNSPMELLPFDLIDEDAAAVPLGPERLWEKVATEWKRREPSSIEYDELRKLFHPELEALKRGPMAKLFENDENRLIEAEARLLGDHAGDDEEFLSRSWRKSRNNGKPIVVFLDNTDRLSEQYQRVIYSFAHRLATNTGATVIVPLRESTFYRARSDGFLDVRSTDLIFHLKSPDLVKILSKRIQYIEKQLGGEASQQDYRLKEWRSEKSWPEFKEKSLRWAELLKNTFLKDHQGMSFLSLLASLSWHSVRLFLLLLRRIHAQLNVGPWRKEEVLAVLMLLDGASSMPRTLFRPVARRHRAYGVKLRILFLLESGVAKAESRKGVAYERILSVLRSYGYRRPWIDAALTELVRERLLECLEIPTEVEFTGEYELERDHSFRVSPLSIVLTSELQFERVILAASSWVLPVHSAGTMKALTTEAKEALSNTAVIGPRELDQFLASNLPEIMASYLLKQLEHEAVPSTRLLSQHEIAATERRVTEVRARLRDISARVPDDLRKSDEPKQRKLFNELRVEEANLNALPIPRNINTARLDNTSRNGALILWALATAKANGVFDTTGAKLTRIINSFVVGDDHSVEPTNISRCLRSPVMKRQSWLTVQAAEKKRQKHFGLGQGWRAVWKATFGEEAPEL